MKVIFFGASSYVLPVIDKLNKNFDLKLVITTESKKESSIVKFCQSQKVPLISLEAITDEFLNTLKKQEASVGVLASFGMIIPKKMLDIFPFGIINIHPSLLPLYRGATPVQSCLLNGDLNTGVSLIKLDTQMDHGPVLTQSELKIDEEDNAQTLLTKLFSQGADILIKVLKDYLANKIIPKPQDDKKATFTQKTLTRQNGFIDIRHLPPKANLLKMIKAYYPWPGVWSNLPSMVNMHTKTNFLNEKDLLRIKFLPGKSLVEGQKFYVQVSGGKPMSILDFINGYPQYKIYFTKFI